MSCRHTAAWLLSLAGLVVPGAWADDDDTRFLQDQTRRSIEQKTQAEGELAPPPGTLLYEGQRYEVPSTLEALMPAIYVAINTQQWTQLPEFVARYRALPGHRPALANMADSLLARFAGDYPQALQRMQQASEQEPWDARILLELSRLLFEDYQEQRAQVSFARALDAGLPPEVQLLTEQYQQAMDLRADWHGGVALGWGYNDNINQANGHYSCLSQFAGICLFERQMPEAIGSALNNYELALQRRVNLGGNHNLQIRPLSYGTFYRRENPSSSASLQDYSTNLAMLQLGYQYLDARNSLALSPTLEHFYRNGHGEYLAHGLLLEGSRALDQRWQLGSSLEAKRYRYSDRGQSLGADYEQFQWGLSASFAPSSQGSLYAGLDLTRKRYAEDVASSREWALRAGYYHAFEGRAGLFVNALAIYREAKNEAYDGFLGAQREDRQQVYILGMGAKGWSLAGISPELRLRHSINHSNLDWAFGFKQTELSLMLRRDF